MTECTKPKAKVSEKVLGCEVSHNWIVIEWEYDSELTISGSYQLTGSINLVSPTIKRKRAIKKMCSRCGKIENI